MISFFRNLFRRKVNESVPETDHSPFAILAETLVEQTPSRVNILEHQVADLSFRYAKVSTLLGRVLHSYMKTMNISDVDDAIADLEAEPPDKNLQRIIITDFERIVFIDEQDQLPSVNI